MSRSGMRGVRRTPISPERLAIFNTIWTCYCPACGVEPTEPCRAILHTEKISGGWVFAMSMHAARGVAQAPSKIEPPPGPPRW